MLLVSALVVQASIAAFSDTTQTQGGEWGAGTVALSDDDGTGQVQFSNDATMVPTDKDQACITVTYDGDTATSVKLYGSTTTNTTDLGEYLDLTVEEVTVTTQGDCAGATQDAQIYTGTLSVNSGAFTVDHTQWSDGLASNWAPSANGETQVYRITVTLQDNDSAQGLDTTGTFTWEAQNT